MLYQLYHINFDDGNLYDILQILKYCKYGIIFMKMLTSLENLQILNSKMQVKYDMWIRFVFADSVTFGSLLYV